MDHGIYVSNKDVLNLVERFDKNQDGKVTYSEFVSEITPKSPTKIFWDFKTEKGYLMWESQILSIYYYEYLQIHIIHNGV